MQRIALWNTAFLGDAVLSLSLVHSLRHAWPEAQLDMYVRSGFGSLFSAQHCLNRVYEVSKKDSLLQSLDLGKQIASRSYNVWVSAHQSFRSSLVAFLSKAPVRVGYTGSWHRKLAYTHTIDRCFATMDETDRLHQLAKALNLPEETLWPTLELPCQAVEQASNFWQKLASGPVLGIHPGSTWGTKRWTPEGFAFVAKEAHKAGCQLLFFAGKGEEAAAAQVIEAAQLANSPGVHNLAGKLSLTELAAYIARLNCYLSNDSGPMHIAWAQHVPLVAVFGPTTRSLGFFPRGEKSQVIEAHNIPCRPCGLHGPQNCPKGHHDCMRRVAPQEVWQACQNKLFPCAL